jgi:hypothetical protein
VPASGVELAAVDGCPVPAGNVRTPDGYLVDEGTARKVAEAMPAGTRAGREPRAGLFVRWCNSRGRMLRPGHGRRLGQLACCGHPAETIAAYTTTLASLRAAAGRPLLDSERHLIQGVINRRAQLDAAEPLGLKHTIRALACGFLAVSTGV